MKIHYGKQWISDDDIERVAEVLKSDFLTTGPVVQEFEKEFAKYVEAKYAVAVANGTAALHLSAKAMGVETGSEVITSPMSFAATSNCILYNSGTPVFSDITDRGVIDPEHIVKKVNQNTTGIIPVHYMGLPCELDEINRIANEHNLFVIEDACHAIGAKYRSSSVGSCKYSDLAAFSFHPVKQITTGEGGIITTNNEELYDLLRLLRTHGITRNKSEFLTSHSEPWFQEMHHLGFNYRLTDIQAALGLSQLSRINEFVARRREIAKAYFDFFEDFEEHVEVIVEREHEFNSYHLFVIKLKRHNERREIFDYLWSKGIHCQVHYIPIYWHPYYRKIGYEKERLQKTESFYEQIISLPMYPALTDTELEFVFSSIMTFFKSK